jgi:hypothetical protein
VTSNSAKSVVFIRADVDDCKTSAKDFNVEVLPSFLLIEQRLLESGRYDDGVVIDVCIGQRIDGVREGIQDWFCSNDENENDEQKKRDFSFVPNASNPDKNVE